MATRTNITEEKLADLNVAYSKNSSVGEITDGIRSMRLAGRNVSDNPSLREAAEYVLGLYGKTVASFDNWEKVVEFLGSIGTETTIEELEEAAARPANVADEFEANKALTSQELKVLLAEYDKYREEKDIEKLADLVKRNPLLRQVSPREIIEAIKRKVALETKEEKLGRPLKEADKTSDEQLLTEARLREQGVKTEKAEILAEKVVQAVKEDRTVTKEAVRVIVEEGENTLDKRVKAEVEQKIDEILRVARAVTYEAKIDKQISEIAETTVERILPVDKVELKETTKELVKSKLEEILLTGEFGKEETAKVGIEVAAAIKVIETDPIKIAVAEAVEKVKVIEQKNEMLVEAVRIQQKFDEVWADFVAVNPAINQEQKIAVRSFVREVVTLPRSGITQHKEAAVNNVTGETNNAGEKITKTQAEQSFKAFDTAISMARGGKEKIENLGRLRGALEKLRVRIPVKNDTVRAVDGVLSIVNKNPGFVKLMETVGKKIEIFNNFYNGIGYKVFAKVGGERAVTWLAGKIGGEAGLQLAKNGLAVIAREGLERGIGIGLKNVFTQIATKVGIQVSAKVAGGVAAKGLAAALGLSNPIGWVIMVGGLVLDIAGKLIKKSIKAIESLAEKLGINLPKIKAGLEDNLGKVGGGLVFFGGGAVAMLLAIPTLLGAAAITSLVGPVIIILFVGLMAYQVLIQGPQISSIKPPEGMGGGQCVLKSEVENLGGAINCNQNAPSNDFPGLTKAKYVDIANRWHTGKNYAEECYNDVVNRALCAGKNPAYVLWAWAHESGASNYSIPDVEDFGIHYMNKPKDFNAQITEFLTLDMGAYCLNAPKIGGNYWLGFATNYLNGSCDPDEPNSVSGQTGRQYLADMQKTWGWVTSEPMPANIQVTPGGVGCGDPSTTSGTSTYAFIDSQGNEWVCTNDSLNDNGMVPNFTPWDPNTPVPEGCPSGLPMHSGSFTQGPFAAGCSHQSMISPAIDIGVGAGTEIRATHAGVVSQNFDPIYGYYVDLHGTCEGKDFYTRYAHMPAGGFRTSNGATVASGDVLGVVDTTGSSTGNHLHFHIYNLETNNFGQYLGLSLAETQQLWGCCGSENGKSCPALR